MVSLFAVSLESSWVPCGGKFGSLLVCQWWSHLVFASGLYVGHIEVMTGTLCW